MIAILKLGEQGILGCDNVGELFEYLNTITERLWTADKLVSVRIRYRGVAHWLTFGIAARTFQTQHNFNRARKTEAGAPGVDILHTRGVSLTWPWQIVVYGQGH